MFDRTDRPACLKMTDSLQKPARPKRMDMHLHATSFETLSPVASSGDGRVSGHARRAVRWFQVGVRVLLAADGSMWAGDHRSALKFHYIFFCVKMCPLFGPLLGP